MPRIQRGAETVPVKPQSVLYALLMTAGLTLSGCGTATPDRMGSGGEVDAPGGEPDQVVEVNSSDPEAASQPAEPEATAEATAEATTDARGETLAALPPEPAINDDPQQLIGMGPASLNAFLGAPELIRREAPASLWQYRAEDCVLDVVLYPDRGGDKVTYLEAREDGTTKMAPRTCLNKLLRARYDGSAG